MIIAIDNNILIQLLKDSAESDKITGYLQQMDAMLLIPSQVLAEFLATDFVQRRAIFLSGKNARSQIASFDEKAALICGEIANNIHALKKEQPRQKTKVDLQILAICIANKVKIILSEDADITKAIEVLGLDINVIPTNKLGFNDLFG